MTLKISSVLDEVIRYVKRNEVINAKCKNSCVIDRDHGYRPDKLRGKETQTKEISAWL